MVQQQEQRGLTFVCEPNESKKHDEATEKEKVTATLAGSSSAELCSIVGVSQQEIRRAFGWSSKERGKADELTEMSAAE